MSDDALGLQCGGEAEGERSCRNSWRLFSLLTYAGS